MLAEAATRRALARGALQPIATDNATVSDGGVRFPVRILARLVQKEAATRLQRAADNAINPFLPYERDLYVADVSESHVCLLNKFNVIDAHLLLVTRAYESQDQLLNVNDFAALWTCLAEFDGLGFYNGGRDAGASQPHKHLQFVPLPLSTDCAPIPIAPLLETLSFSGKIATAPRLPYRHALASVASFDLNGAKEAAQRSLDIYADLMSAAGIATTRAEDGERHAAPYNLLLTREWMMAVPRCADRFASIPVNALGYAGGFLVRDAAQLDSLRKIGPLTVLRQTGFPAARQG